MRNKVMKKTKAKDSLNNFMKTFDENRKEKIKRFDTEKSFDWMLNQE